MDAKPAITDRCSLCGGGPIKYRSHELGAVCITKCEASTIFCLDPEDEEV